MKCILYTTFKKIVGADFFYLKKWFFKILKNLAPMIFSKIAHIKRMKHYIWACQKLKTFTKNS